MPRFARPTLSGRVFYHNELGWPRHPVCTAMNVAMLATMLHLWQKQDGLNTEQHVYFAVTCCLYLSSCLYHTLPQQNAEGARINSLIRFADQTAICLFLGAAALVFVTEQPEAKQAIYALIGSLIAFKWFDFRGGFGFRCRQMVSVSFLAAGIVTLIVCLTFHQGQALGMPLFWLAMSLFIWKLYIYNFQKGVLHASWQTAESGHAILAMAIITLTSVVVTI